ncbi:MAG: putative metallopeptidase [Nanoarchaeota archaeon]
MKYEPAPDLQEQSNAIASKLFPHVKLDRVKCFRSFGSSSRNTVARCHTIGKLMQKAIGVQAHYAIEFITENFNKLPEEEKIKVVIHELMHIPKTFGGGFKHHDYVCSKNINMFYKKWKQHNEPEKSNTLFKW